MVKFCRFDGARRCFWASCSVFDRVNGMVYCCAHHPNPSGFNRARRVVREHG